MKGSSCVTAILVDGGFFLKRARRIYGKLAPAKLAATLHRNCLDHLKDKGNERSELYRILFYDCPPLSKKAHNPISGKAIDFALTPVAAWRLAFHGELKKLRKVALRLGELNESQARWVLNEKRLLALCRKEIALDELVEDDVQYEVRQKGVDMRIGLDIASLTLKRLANQIVLVSGDSDFVPAAKFARRDGIDFILDPMWAPIKADLFEHIDGLRSTCPKPRSFKPTETTSRKGKLSGGSP